MCDFIEANEPRLIAFNEYLSEDGTEVGVVQVHPDADSMEFHMGMVRERAERAYAETLGGATSIQVYGMPSDTVLAIPAGRQVPHDERNCEWSHADGPRGGPAGAVRACGLDI